MRQSSTHHRGARRRVPNARDLGWDDSLYQEPGDGPPPDRSGDEERSSAEPAGASGRGRRGRRVLRWFAVTLAVLILLLPAAGYLYYRHLNGNIVSDSLNLGDHKLEHGAPDHKGRTPLNILLLGSDSRNSEENIRLGGARADRDRKPLADVQMLMHVSADRENMSVISIPRDTRVTIPKCTDGDDGRVYAEYDGTINASLQNGGPGCTVATWEQLTGIPIDHFMMIDFAGVVNMADAVGGVPVCVDANVYDSKSGLRLRKGDSLVKGEQALQWLRTRHGFEDGSDIGRTKAQRMYMSSMVRQLKAGTKLTDPGKLRKLAEAATKALTVDEGLGTVKKLYDLGEDLKQVPTERITMVTMPWTQDPQDPAHVVPKPGDAEKIFSLVRGDTALDGKDAKKSGAGEERSPSAPADPKDQIPVSVRNGTGSDLQPPVTGRASVVADQLTQLGFARTTVDSAPQSQAESSVSYPSPEQRGNAEAVARELGLPPSAVRQSASTEQITLVVGADWRSGTTYQRSADEGDQKAPDSADALNGDDKGACMTVNPLHTW
ncbi:LCP family protein [Streptomyces sp. TP-A0874]|uniref:LCP family protein n=1 Tax=Streptomyces sp. TP-A0874 TaxID=549819 RepID=UPI000852ED80|nr:LCP family protein [Streptomyces sp. TP-A0874]